ncbi:MAG: LptA/OstA family protein [Thermodesulfobacteriota bacterium]
MKKYPCRSLDSGRHGALVALVLAVLILSGISVSAKPLSPSPAPKEENNRIDITSDRLEADNNSNFAEFIGNVKAAQGTTIITADRLKVFYKGGAEKIENAGPGEESIEKIVSTGNVVIHFEDRVAKADHAVYVTESRILILTGPKSTLTSGKNTVIGEKITLYRNDGKIHVESGKAGRVQATFFSTGKGLN